MGQIVVIATIASSTVGEETLIGKSVLPRIDCKVPFNGESVTTDHLSQPLVVMAVNGDTLSTNRGAVDIGDVVTMGEALEYYTCVIEADSRNAVAFRCRAFVFWQDKEYENALDDISRAQKIDPTNAAYIKNQGDVLCAMKRTNQAVERYRKATKLRPEYFDAYLNCGVMLFKQDRYSEAAEFLLKAIALDPSMPEAWMFLGISHEHLGRYDRSIVEMSRAIAVKDDPGFRQNRCIVYLKSENYENALSDAEHLIQRKAELGFAYTARSRALFHLGRSKEALDQLDDAISQGLTDFGAFEERAKLWASLGEYEKQLQDLISSLGRLPENPGAHMALSQFLSTTTCDEKRDGSLALKHAKLALNSHAGGHIVPYDILAAAKAELQKFDEAERIQKEAIRTTKREFARLLEERYKLIDRISAEVNTSEAGRDEWAHTYEMVEGACRASEWKNPRQIDRLSILAAEMGDAENAKKLQHLRHQVIEESVVKDMEVLRVKYENRIPARFDTGNFIDSSGRIDDSIELWVLSR